MKSIIKNVLQRIIGERGIFFLNLIYNYMVDCRLFYKHSNIFIIDSYPKIEAKIILDYHALEKGLLFKNTKPKFAKNRILSLHKNLGEDIIISSIQNSQVSVAFQLMCKYYELHRSMGVDIEDYFPKSKYQFYKDTLENNYSNNFEGTVHSVSEQFYKHNQSNFLEFSYSRKSVRNFTGEKISKELIVKAIQLASNAPSVCNRQPSKVYLIEDKTKVDHILHVQSGFKGYTDNVSQILILTTDRSYFYTVGERNQLYIDGGLFLMNLLYSLHYYKIGNCPANWGKSNQEEKLIEKYVSIPESEKIICLIPIGKVEEEFKVCLSKRRDVKEILHEL